MPPGEGVESAWTLESSVELYGSESRCVAGGGHFAHYPSELDWALLGCPHDRLLATVEVSPGSRSICRQGDGVNCGRWNDGCREACSWEARFVPSLTGLRGKGPLGTSPPSKCPQSPGGQRPPCDTRLCLWETPSFVCLENGHVLQTFHLESAAKLHLPGLKRPLSSEQGWGQSLVHDPVVSCGTSFLGLL